MIEGVTENQAIATPDNENVLQNETLNDKELNFRRLEDQRNQEKEGRLRAELQAEKSQMQTEMIQQQFESLKNMMTPKEKDPLDEIEDLSELDPKKLKEILSKRDMNIRKETEESVLRRIEENKNENKRTNFLKILQEKYDDFDSVMNKEVVERFKEQEPDALDALFAIEDPYVRCEKAYKFIKKRVGNKTQETTSTIKDRIEENLKNPYLLRSSSVSPGAVDFDVKSVSDKQKAYAKLKAAQRRPIGSGQVSLSR